MCDPAAVVVSSFDWDALAVAGLGKRVALALEAGDMREARHYARLRTAARRRAKAKQESVHVTYV